jgi:hypothetical protein
MFESDQHDPHDYIAEASHSGSSSSHQELHDPSFYDEEAPEALISKPKRTFPLVLVGFGVLAALIVALLFMNKPKQEATSQPAGDLGPGVVAASGLRGHLITQWEGKAKDGKLQYQLRIEAMMPSMESGFALVVARPPAPLYVNIRVLDPNGFALCGKDILFHFDPTKSTPPPPDVPHTGSKKVPTAQLAAERAAARDAQIQRLQAAEADRERGKDMFQNLAGSDGMINAISAQGDLPCTADAYKRANYWDFSTNFPTVEEQEALRDPKMSKAQHEDDPQEQARAARRKAQRKPTSAFYIQGDERVVGYDARKALLEAEAGKRFVIDKTLDRGTASRWASNFALIHYRCDQHASCALTSAGGQSAVHARLDE